MPPEFQLRLSGWWGWTSDPEACDSVHRHTITFSENGRTMYIRHPGDSYVGDGVKRASVLRQREDAKFGRKRRIVTTSSSEVLKVWFGEDLETPQSIAERSRLWFAPDPTFDGLIRQRFEMLPDRALRGELTGWTEAAQPTLALVIVLDQFPRNLYRDSARSFAYDSAALSVLREALSRDLDGELHPLEAAFLYLPLEHAEDRASQAQCVSLFRKLVERAPAQLSDRFEAFVEYAERHRAVIEQFGRFPHRNSALGRRSTPEELRYLESGGETFSAGDGNA